MIHKHNVELRDSIYSDVWIWAVKCKCYFDVFTRYPNATAEELAAGDNVCIICREEMVAGNCKKLPCNHIFHASCLRSWFQRQQTCPTCRMDVLRPPAPATPAPAPAAPAAQGPAQQQQQQQPMAPMFPGFPPMFPPQAPPPTPPAASAATTTASGNLVY